MGKISMAVTKKWRRYTTSVGRFLHNLERGRFHRLVANEDLMEWHKFLNRLAATPGKHRVILGLRMNDYTVWAEYEMELADQDYMEARLEGLYIPHEPEHTLPEELAGLPKFVTTSR